MESPKTSLFLMVIVLCVALLFDQCGRGNGSQQEIPYNPDSASVHVISFPQAAKLITNFNLGKVELSRQLKDTAFLNKNFSMPIAEKFNRDAIAQLLNEKGAKGLRIYLGRDSVGLVKLVLVAVDEKGDDITGNFGKIIKPAQNSQQPVAMEAGQRCPTLCSGPGGGTGSSSSSVSQ
jgi:hypothetical protein